MEKTLGQIAYEAYCATTNGKSAVTGADLPHFDECPAKVQIGWEAAGKAVEDALEPDH